VTAGTAGGPPVNHSRSPTAACAKSLAFPVREAWVHALLVDADRGYTGGMKLTPASFHRPEIAKDTPVMDLEDHPDFPRFNTVSTGLRDAEDRLLQALKSGNKAEIVAAKVVLMGTLDEYSKVADGIGEDPS